MLSHLGRRFSGAPGKISFLSPDSVDFPSESFLKSASTGTLGVYAASIDADIKILSSKVQLLFEEAARRSHLEVVAGADLVPITPTE